MVFVSNRPSLPQSDRSLNTNVIPMEEGWKRQLEKNNNGNYKKNSRNVMTIFENDPCLMNAFAYNTFSNENYVIKALPWDSDFKGPRLISDLDDSCLRNYFDVNYGIRSRELIDDCLNQVIHQNSFHPIRRYLQGLAWDQTPRLDGILIRYLGAEDNEYVRTVTRKAFVAAVARVMRPGCKYDTILTLSGPQGIGKSSIFRMMGKSWFLDSFQHTNDKDSYQSIQGSWIVELGELSAYRKSEIESFKNFVTSTVDKYRPSFGKRVIERPRQCVFFGTTNEDTFLRDATGHRRFWPVSVTRKMSAEDMGEFESLVDQHWAEAFYLYNQGEQLYLDEQQEKSANAAREQYVDESPLKGMIEEYLELLLPVNWKDKSIQLRREFVQDELGNRNYNGSEKRMRISAIEVFCELLGKSKGDFKTSHGREINAILKTLKGWRFIKTQRVGADYGNQSTYERIIENGGE